MPPERYVKVISINGAKSVVRRKWFVSQSLKRFHSFGYTTLTAGDVEAQIDLLEAGKNRIADGITVIGMFMKDEVLPKPLERKATSVNLKPRGSSRKPRV